MQYIGALIGDWCGAGYEWSNSTAANPDEIEILKSGRFTDDSVLTIATMDWINNGAGDDYASYLKKWARAYPRAGYGGMFREWVMSESLEPFNSFGNGAGMRVSPCAYYANSLDECLELAKKSAEATHNHEEGVKGAQAIAEAIYLARSGAGKQDMRNVLSKDFGYDLSKELVEIGTNAHPFDATCQVTVPEAIMCFLESNSYLDAIRKAIWIGGDSDTIADMTAAIAEAYYGIPYFIEEMFKERLPEDFKEVIVEFNKNMLGR